MSVTKNTTSTAPPSGKGRPKLTVEIPGKARPTLTVEIPGKVRPKLTVQIPGKEWPGTWYLPSVASVDDTTPGSTSQFSLHSVDMLGASGSCVPQGQEPGCITCLDRGDNSWLEFQPTSTDPEAEQGMPSNSPFRFDPGPRPLSPDSIPNLDPELYIIAQREYWRWNLQHSGDFGVNPYMHWAKAHHGFKPAYTQAPCSCNFNARYWVNSPSEVARGLQPMFTPHEDSPMFFAESPMAHSPDASDEGCPCRPPLRRATYPMINMLYESPQSSPSVGCIDDDHSEGIMNDGSRQKWYQKLTKRGLKTIIRYTVSSAMALGIISMYGWSNELA